MKKIIAFALVIFMLAACISCQKNDSQGKDTSSNDTVQTTAQEDEKKKIVFSAGYSRVDITPKTLPILAAESSADYFTKVKDPLYATCIAVSDGTNTALILTLDIKGTYDYIQTGAMKVLTKATGLPEANIMISATHNHSAPASSDDGNKPKFDWDDGIYKWLDNEVIAPLGKLAKDAIADLAPAEVYTATEDTTGMAFVRRYLHADGGYTAIQNQIGKGNSTPIVGYESKADPDLQIIKFDRQEKKDIVISNWQAHVAHAVGVYPNAITADLVYEVRSNVEKESDVLYAYYAGASGNINLNKKVFVKGEKVYGGYEAVGKALAKLINKALGEEMTKVNTGEVKASLIDVSCTVRQDSLIKRAQAKEILAAGYSSSLMSSYGFTSSYEVNAVLARAEIGSSKEKVPIGAISFGDIAFVSAPYEMFDTSGMQVKEGSPFEMTFVLSCAGGNYDYMPDKNAYEHGGYEVFRCRYTMGTAEKLVEGFLGMLNEQKTEK